MRRSLLAGTAVGLSAVQMGAINASPREIVCRSTRPEPRILASSLASTKPLEGHVSVLGTLNRAISRLWHAIWEAVLHTLRVAHLATIFTPAGLALPPCLLEQALRGDLSSSLLHDHWFPLFIRCLDAAGPAFVKLGQWASTRPDIFSWKICEHFSHLHSKVRAEPIADTLATVQRALGDLPFEEVFTEFEVDPLGSGCIAQVHRAKLKYSDHWCVKSVEGDDSRGLDQWVVVKVKRRHADSTIRRDLRLMRLGASVVGPLPTMEWLIMASTPYSCLALRKSPSFAARPPHCRAQP